MTYTSAKPYFYGTGRRKKSVARVRVYPGTGAITINGRDVDDYFGLETLKLIVCGAGTGALAALHALFGIDAADAEQFCLQIFIFLLHLRPPLLQAHLPTTR